jgi:3',5'-cyclic-AMP phosphodiesterase
MAILLTPSTRRHFLAAGAATLAARATPPAAGKARWAWLSDTHSPADPADSFRGFRPFDNLKQIVTHVLEGNFDGAYVNGDMARNRGTEAEYKTFRQLVAPLAEKTTLALGLGNHDDREQFLAAFTTPGGEKQPVNRKHVTSVRSGGVRMVFLDSAFVPGQVPGLLGKEQRTWLERVLGTETAPVLLFVHHTLTDDDGALLDSDRFLKIATAHRNVKAVFYGHSHRYQLDIVDGLHLVNLPAAAYNFSDDQPVGWVEASLTKDGCDLTLHAVGGNRDGDAKTRSIAWRA